MCNIDINGSRTINFVCRVLCLIKSMVINIAPAPPNKPEISSVFSGIRRIFLLAASLSYTVRITEITDIKMKKAKVMYFIKISDLNINILSF